MSTRTPGQLGLLMASIQKAQTLAGEAVVVQDLHARGLIDKIPPSVQNLHNALFDPEAIQPSPGPGKAPTAPSLAFTEMEQSRLDIIRQNLSPYIRDADKMVLYGFKLNELPLDILYGFLVKKLQESLAKPPLGRENPLG